MKSTQAQALCPCGSGNPFQDCCRPFLQAVNLPANAEALMRSRYTAYVLQDAPYLLATWHPDTRPKSLDFDQESPPQWLGLAIKRHLKIDADHAEVEFVARYKINGRGYRMQETSRFECIDGHWLYLDGDLVPA
jgi:SEC-C motif-containing protein